MAAPPVDPAVELARLRALPLYDDADPDNAGLDQARVLYFYNLAYIAGSHPATYSHIKLPDIAHDAGGGILEIPTHLPGVSISQFAVEQTRNITGAPAIPEASMPGEIAIITANLLTPNGAAKPDGITARMEIPINAVGGLTQYKVSTVMFDDLAELTSNPTSILRLARGILQDSSNINNRIIKIK